MQGNDQHESAAESLPVLGYQRPQATRLIQLTERSSFIWRIALTLETSLLIAAVQFGFEHWMRVIAAISLLGWIGVMLTLWLKRLPVPRIKRVCIASGILVAILFLVIAG
jgi:hypothetical protein